MGCAGSFPLVSNLSNFKQSGRMLVVSKDPDAEMDCWKIDVYSLQKFQFETTIDLPCNPADPTQKLAEDYSVASHPYKPCIILSGGVYRNKEKTTPCKQVWMIDWFDETITKSLLVDLPKAFQCHHSCMTSQNGNSYLYIFSSDEHCMRLNLSTEHWENIASPPFPNYYIQDILCLHEEIFLIGDGKLFHYEPLTNDSEGNWESTIDEGMANALAAVAGNFIFILSNNADEFFLYKCDPESGKFFRISNSISNDIKGSQTMMSGGSNFIYFTGYHHSIKDISVLEYNIALEKVEIAGYLKNCTADHAVFYMAS